MREHRRKVNAKLWDFGNKIDDLDREIEYRKALIRQLDNPLKAVNCDGMPSGGKVSDPTLEAVQLMERYQAEINKLVRIKERTYNEFEQYIEPLKHQHKTVLRLRYIECLRPQQIATEMSYSEDHVKTMLRKSQDQLYDNTF